MLGLLLLQPALEHRAVHALLEVVLGLGHVELVVVAARRARPPGAAARARARLRLRQRLGAQARERVRVALRDRALVLLDGGTEAARREGRRR